mmetsp:Transcript_8740/g.19797  ORF Transcript_8740/g.19797 Transcript_8740/m.19797 type:complete len:207 (+) Transcript_8740:479-1099(+)
MAVIAAVANIVIGIITIITGSSSSIGRGRPPTIGSCHDLDYVADAPIVVASVVALGHRRCCGLLGGRGSGRRRSWYRRFILGGRCVAVVVVIVNDEPVGDLLLDCGRGLWFPISLVVAFIFGLIFHLATTSSRSTGGGLGLGSLLVLTASAASAALGLGRRGGSSSTGRTPRRLAPQRGGRGGFLRRLLPAAAEEAADVHNGPLVF